MLGPPNPRKTSYRNRYFAPPGGSAHDDLKAMKKAGLADFEIEGRSDDKPNGRHVFGWLTRAGAEMALEHGEALCPEDFPQ